jgi:hypothetical protein
MFGKKMRSLLSILIVSWFAFTMFPVQSILAGKENVKNRLVLNHLILDQSVASSRKVSLQISFKPSDLSFQPTESGLLVMLKSCENLNIPDQPALPCIRKELPIKSNEVVTGIQTTHVSSFSIPLPKVGLKYAQEPREIGMMDQNSQGDPINKQSKNIQLPEFFPTCNFDYVMTQNQKTKQLTLQINPVYIDHNQLLLVTHMVIEVTYGSKFSSTSFQKANPQPISIILAPDDLVNEAKKLQTIQEKDGYATSVKLISELQSGEESPQPQIDGVIGFLDATTEVRSRVSSYDNSLARKIQKWLKDLVALEKIQYLTIMGDATFVPPSYYVFSPDNRDSYDRWIPTDIFYSAPDSSGKSFPVLISIGRLPVRDKEEAAGVVDKIEKYRKTLDPSWFKNADIMAGDPFNGDYFGELSTTKAINADLLEGLNISRYYKSEAKFSTEPFMKAMKENKHGFVWGFGHGGGDGLALEPGYITSKNIIDLPEKVGLPIFISEACGNGAFDSRLMQPSFGTNASLKHPTSFSEAILTSKGGGIAYVGGARVNYAGWNMIYEKGIPNLLRIYYMDAILEYFMESYHNQEGALGDIARKTLEIYAQRDWFAVNAPLVKTFFGFTLQGDPTLKIPFFKNPNKRDIPLIEPDLTKPVDVSDIPLYSIDDGSRIQVKSNTETLSYILCDYNDAGKPVKAQGVFQKPVDKVFSKDFSEFLKTRMTIRVCTDDGKENRIVFYGRYNNDLVIQKPYDLQMIRKNEKKSFWAKVYNDGIYEAKDVEVTVKDNEQVLVNTTFASIPILSSRYVYYTFQSSDDGIHPLTIQTPVQEGETAISDNQAMNPLSVVKGTSFRVGVLADSPQLDRSYYENRLMLAELNKKLMDMGHNIEICVIPMGRDENGKTNIDRLNLDAIILYSTDYYSYPIQELIAELERFENKGGMIFGFLSLGQNSYGIDLVDIQSFFGISRSEKFLLWRTDEKTKTFEINDSFSDLFPKSNYEITSRYALLPKGKDWKSIEMEEGEVVGTDKDNQYALIKNRNRFLFSGFLSEKDLRKQDQSMEFFIDLLLQIKKLPVDLVIDEVKMLPAVGRKNHTSNCSVTIRNKGLMDVENVEVVLNRTNKEMIPLIPAKSTASIQYSLDWAAISGYQGLQIEINPSKNIKEDNYSNNLYKSSYYVAEQGEPDTPPTLEFANQDNQIVTDPSYTVKGHATPFSIIMMNNEQIAQNNDGSFQKMVVLKHGKNQFLFSIQKGSLFGQEMIYEITYSPYSQLFLKIGEAKAVLESKIESLESAPFIKSGSTFVPLRFISNAFQAKINFIAKPNQEIQLEYNGSIVYLWINKTKAQIKSKDGQIRELTLSAPPVIVLGRTFVPLRFIAEAFGAKVIWSAETESIEIQIPKVPASQSDMKILHREEEPKKPGIIASSDKMEMILNPSCIDQYNEMTYVSQYDGIYIYNEEDKLSSIIPWDQNFVNSITEESLRGLSSTPNRGFFRITEKLIFISDTHNIYVLDNPSGVFLYKIHGVDYKNYAEPLIRFGFIQDMEVFGNQLFVLNPYEGISVIDLLSKELVGKYTIPENPWDMTIFEGKIYVCALYGGIISLNLDGSEMKSFYFEDQTYCNTLMVSESGVFYLNTFLPGNTVLRFTYKPEFKMLDSINLSGAIGDYIERMVAKGDKYYAITFSDRNIGTFSIESKFIRCDENLKVSTDFGKEDLKKIAKAGDFIANPGQVWVTESNDFLVSLLFPSNSNMVRYYDEKGVWIRDIKVMPRETEIQVLDVAYAGNQTISVLYKKKTYFVENFHFTKEESKVTSEVVSLKMKTGSLLPTAFAIGNGVVAVSDAITGRIILFDAVSGLEKTRIDLTGNENFASVSTVAKMILRNDNLYVLDSVQSFIGVYALKDSLLEYQIRIPKFDSSFSRGRFDFQVVDEKTISVLDKSLSQFYQITDGIVTDLYGDKAVMPMDPNHPNLSYVFWNPASFDQKNGTFVVNDLGNKRIVFGKYPRETLAQPPYIQTSVEEISLIAYDNGEISFPLGFQIFNTEELYQLDAQNNEWIRFDSKDNSKRSGTFTVNLFPNRVSDNKVTNGSFLIKAGKATKEIKIHLDKRVNKVNFIHNSAFILSDKKLVISKNPVLIEKDTLFVPVVVLPEIFEVLMSQQKNKVSVTVGSLIIEIDTITSKAQLVTSIGKSPFDLKGKVKIQKGIVYLPMNGIFEFLGKKAVIKGTTGFVEF